MKLWLVQRTDLVDYDQYDAFIAAAETEAEARMIHPGRPEGWSERFPEWIRQSDVDTLKVTLIGTAAADILRGVVLASYNAG